MVIDHLLIALRPRRRGYAGAGTSVRYTGHMPSIEDRLDHRPRAARTATPPRRPPVPALRRGLAVLGVLATRPAPVSATAISRQLGLARSTVYELLGELAAAGYVVHLPQQRRWGLGVAAFEIGSAYLRGQPLERLGRPILRRLVGSLKIPGRTGGLTAHLGVLHGPQTLYLAKESAKESTGAPGPTLVTDVGVRLPAALTATGLSLLAALPPAQVRAVFADRAAFVVRTGSGPTTLPELRADLAAVRRRGWATEHGRVTEGTASVAAAAYDHNARPLAAIGLTLRHQCSESPCGETYPEFAARVSSAAAELTSAVGGRAPGADDG